MTGSRRAAFLEEDEQAFVARVTRLNDTARQCAEETIARANLCDDDRNTLLRAVIGRLKEALAA